MNSLELDIEHPLTAGLTLSVHTRIPLDQAPTTVLFGPSGAGKTSLLRMIAGLSRPRLGRIALGAQVWTDTAQRRHILPQHRKIGMVFQDYALFPHLNARENIGFGIAHLPRAQRQQRVDALMHQFLLTDAALRIPAQLSGGERQRCALARALATDPQLLLLDEPLSALDAPTRDALRSALRHTLSTIGLPALLITHDRTEAMALGDRILVIEGGRILQEGPVSQVFSEPASAEVARIVGTENVLRAEPVTQESGLLTLRIGQAQLNAVATGNPLSGEFRVCIRAEDITLERPADIRSSARNHLRGQIVRLSPEGALVRVHVDVGCPLVALVTRRSCEELSLEVGQTVVAVVKAQAVHVFSDG